MVGGLEEPDFFQAQKIYEVHYVLGLRDPFLLCIISTELSIFKFFMRISNFNFWQRGVAQLIRVKKIAQIFLILQVSLSFNGKFSNAHYLMTLPRLFNVKKVLILKSESMPNISSIMKTIYRYFDTDFRPITHLFQYYKLKLIFSAY